MSEAHQSSAHPCGNRGSAVQELTFLPGVSRTCAGRQTFFQTSAKVLTCPGLAGQAAGTGSMASGASRAPFGSLSSRMWAQDFPSCISGSLRLYFAFVLTWPLEGSRRSCCDLVHVPEGSLPLSPAPRWLFLLQALDKSHTSSPHPRKHSALFSNNRGTVKWPIAGMH